MLLRTVIKCFWILILCLGVALPLHAQIIPLKSDVQDVKISQAELRTALATADGPIEELAAMNQLCLLALNANSLEAAQEISDRSLQLFSADGCDAEESLAKALSAYLASIRSNTVQDFKVQEALYCARQLDNKGLRIQLHLIGNLLLRFQIMSTHE